MLLLTIESGIWINLSIPYFMGESVNFIGYLVINTVQLGATIDYGILLTTHYLRHRRRVPARKAAHLALGETFPSLLVSAGILATAGFALGFSSSMSAVSTLGFLLVLLDRVIRRTTWHANFAPVAAAEPAVPAASEVADAASPVAAEGSEPAPLPASEGDES